MPIGSFGRVGAGMANTYAARAESAGGHEPGVTPLRPGDDPLLALDPATRDSIVNWDADPVGDREVEKTFGDRLVGGLVGAGIGAVVGFLLLNGFGRGRYRAAFSAKPMNPMASLAWAGIGAAIGGISGFARGRSPLDVDPRERVVATLGAPQAQLGGSNSTDPITGVLTLASAPSHAAFASLTG